MKSNFGFFGVYKPKGISSAKVVGKVKSVLKQGQFSGKIGHMGTLDLEAEGVLVIAIGSATKLFDFFLQKSKTYQTTFKFGVLTDTDDTTGNVLATSNIIPGKEEIENAVKILKEKERQVPPNFCANKISGKNAYELARVGKSFELKEKSIKVYKFDLVKQLSKSEFVFEIECSSGTYIRALARDLGKLLSTYCITSSIIRTKCGVLCKNNSIMFENLSLDAINNALLLPSQLLTQIDCVNFDEDQIAKLKNGQKIKTDLNDGLYFAKNKFCDKMLVEVENFFAKQKVFLGD